MTKAELPSKNWQIWILAVRPKTLWAAVAPVIIGGVIAFDAGYENIPIFLAALLGAIFIQIGTNFANDYFDFKKGSDRLDRKGPLRVTQAGLISPKQIKIATVLIFTLAFLIGIYLVWRGGLPIVIIGLFSILFGVLYTGGPYPLGYNGLGDIFVLIFFGPVAVGGTYYCISLDVNWQIIIAGLPPGMLSVAILSVNNLRDIDSDKISNKKTLAVRFGATFTKIEYIVMLSSTIVFPLVFLFGYDRSPFVLLASLSFIFSLPLIKKVLFENDASILNNVLAGTGKVLALYSILFSIGWLL